MKKIIVILVMLTSCFVFVGCNKDNDKAGKFEPQTITPTLIAQGELHGGSLEGIAKQNLVIKTQDEWDNLKNAMNLANGNITDHFSEKDIDFSMYQVIAVFDEVKSAAGWSIDITGITEYRDSIVVTVENLNKGGAASVITQPYHIVKMSVSKKEVVFQGNIPYKPCPCEEGKPVGISQGKAYLFKDSVSSINYQLVQEGIYQIVFNVKKNIAFLVIPYSSFEVGEIYNFSDFVKESDIPQDGCNVYFEGIMCSPPCVQYQGKRILKNAKKALPLWSKNDEQPD